MHSLARLATCDRYVVQPTAMDWGEQDWDKTRRLCGMERFVLWSLCTQRRCTASRDGNAKA